MQLLRLFWPPMFVFFLHVFLVEILHVYNYYPWLDIPMHYLGGLSLAYSFWLAQTWLQERKFVNRLDQSIEWILVFCLVSTVAVVWEFAEFLLDHLFGTNLQISLPNTMQDLLMGMLGAATIVGYKIFTALQRFDIKARDLS